MGVRRIAAGLALAGALSVVCGRVAAQTPTTTSTTLPPTTSTTSPTTIAMTSTTSATTTPASTVLPPVPSDGVIELYAVCSDAALGVLWSVGNMSSAEAVEVSLFLNGMPVEVVTLQPGQIDNFSTVGTGTMEAFAGGLLAARAESNNSFGGCFSVGSLCADRDDGQVWELHSMRAVSVELQIGGVTVGTFDMSFGSVQFASTAPGNAQVLVGGVVVAEAAPGASPCAALFPVCADPLLGYFFGVENRRAIAAALEVRAGGVTVSRFELPPQRSTEIIVRVAGTYQLYLKGVLVQEAETATEPCGGPPVLISRTCFDAASAEYRWVISNQRNIDLDLELRLDGRPAGSIALPPYDHGEPIVTNASSGLLEAFVDGTLVARAPSSSAPCTATEPTGVGPSRLPGTGGTTRLLGVALAALTAGALLLVTKRRTGVRL
jgi:hypothetical protein